MGLRDVGESNGHGYKCMYVHTYKKKKKKVDVRIVNIIIPVKEEVFVDNGTALFTGRSTLQA